MSILDIVGSIIPGGSAIVKAISGVIDDIGVSRKEQVGAEIENRKLGIETLKIESEAEKAENAEITQRQIADMASDSWLSKNVRPLALIYLTVIFTIFAISSTFLLEEKQIETLKIWVPIFSSLLICVYVAYFGSRGAEKVTQMLTVSKAK